VLWRTSMEGLTTPPEYEGTPTYVFDVDTQYSGKLTPRKGRFE